MSAKTNGGPAFPAQPIYQHPHGATGMSSQEGMTLRDYFAVHCDQPGEAEIASAAGLVWDSGMLVIPREHDSFDERVTFNQWWWRLPQVERFALYARVRYSMADALLAERSK